MGWILFQIAAWLLVLMFIPLHKLKRLWVAGMIGLLMILPIDGTLVRLGAIRYFHNGLFIYGMPLPYWLAYFPGGMLFDHLRPKNLFGRLLYIPAASIAYLIVELLVKYLGYYAYIDWNAYNSFILNLFSFTVSLWIFEWREEYTNKRRDNSP